MSKRKNGDERAGYGERKKAREVAMAETTWLEWLRAWRAWAPGGLPIGQVQLALDAGGDVGPELDRVLSASFAVAGMPVSRDRFPSQRVIQRLREHVAGREIDGLRLELVPGSKRRTSLRVFSREEWAQVESLQRTLAAVIDGRAP